MAIPLIQPTTLRKGWIPLLLLVAASASAQTQTPLQFTHPENMPQALRDALFLEFASRNYQLVETISESVTEQPAQHLAVDQESAASGHSILIQRFGANGSVERMVRLQGDLHTVDPRSLAIAAGSLFDALPGVTPTDPEVVTTAPSVVPARLTAPAPSATTPPGHAESATTKAPSWTPEQGTWFVTAQVGGSARSEGSANFSRGWRPNVQAGFGIGFYVLDILRLELSSALVMDSIETMRMAWVLDLPFFGSRIHLGARGAVVIASGQRSLAIGGLLGLAWDAFQDIVMGPRLYVGYEPVADSDFAPRPKEYVYTASFHTSFHLDP